MSRSFLNSGTLIVISYLNITNMPIIEFIGSKFRKREKKGGRRGRIAKHLDVQYLPDNRTGI
jgi:hypothetical protein